MRKIAGYKVLWQSGIKPGTVNTLPIVLPGLSLLFDKDQGLFSPNILKKILCPFLQDLVNMNVTQLLIGYTIRFSQSEVVLHSNAARKILRTRL